MKSTARPCFGILSTPIDIKNQPNPTPPTEMLESPHIQFKIEIKVAIQPMQKFLNYNASISGHFLISYILSRCYITMFNISLFILGNQHQSMLFHHLCRKNRCLICNVCNLQLNFGKQDDLHFYCFSRCAYSISIRACLVLPRSQSKWTPTWW